MNTQHKYPSEIFDQFFNNSIDLLCIADTEGYFHKLNNEWERTLGYNLNDLEGKRFIEFVHPEDVEATINATSQLANNQTVGGFVNRYRHKNGTYRWIEWRSFPAGGMIYASARDITHHVETETRLRNSEEKFALAFKTTPDAISITRLRDGRFLDISDVYTDLTGYTHAEVLGKTSFDINIWVNPAERLRLSKGLMDNGIVKNMEAQFRTKDGSILDCLISASLITIENEKCLLAITKDITDMKRANAALKESESILKATIKAISDGLLILKPNGQVSHYNEGLLQMFNSRDHANYAEISSSFNFLKQWLPQSKTDSVNLDEILKNPVPTFDVLELNDGRVIEQHTYPLKLEDEKKAGRVWLFRDITEVRNQENLIRENQEKFRIAFENAPSGMSIIKPNGEYMAVNPKLCEMFGYTADDFLYGTKSTILKITHPDDIKLSNRWIKKIVSGDTSEPELEKRYIHKDGHVVWGLVRAQWLRNEDGSLKIAVNHVLDITKRKEAEQEIKKSRELLAKAQHIAQIASFEVDLDTRKGFFSEEMYRFFQLDPEKEFPTLEVFLELIHPEDRHKIVENNLADYKEDRVTFEYRSNPAYGPIRYFLSKTEYFSDKEKNKHTLVGFVQDITIRKKADEAIKTLNRELEKKVEERTHKLNEAVKDLEAFAYSVSHDLRAPIRHIDGFLKLLYSKLNQPNESINNYYNKIREAASRMSVMIDSLLSFSRLGRKEINLSCIDTNELVREVIENLKPDLEKREILWKIHLLPALYADKNLIKLVFENLISNAIKYTSGKSKPEIEVGISQNDNEYIELFIKDSGIGFDMNYAGKLFGVFQRLHNSEEYEGIGIGLANVKQIIEKHNGWVRAEGKLNEGATIYIKLPKIDYHV